MHTAYVFHCFRAVEKALWAVYSFGPRPTKRAKMWLWLEPGAKFIIVQEEAVFLKPEKLPSVEQVLAATKSDAPLANVPKTLCFPLFLSRVNFVQFKWT